MMMDDEGGNAVRVTTDGGESAQSSTGIRYGNVSELASLLQTSKLTELRTTYNGSYGSSVLFYPPEATYYVAIFQKKHFWRVVKTTDAAVADHVYRGFVNETATLSAAEISSKELAAQKTQLATAIERSQERMQGLQADLANAQTQQSVVSERESAQANEVRKLATQNSSAQVRLNELRQQIRTLETQAEEGLPAPGLPTGADDSGDQ